MKPSWVLAPKIQHTPVHTGQRLLRHSMAHQLRVTVPKRDLTAVGVNITQRGPREGDIVLFVDERPGGVQGLCNVVAATTDVVDMIPVKLWSTPV